LKGLHLGYFSGTQVKLYLPDGREANVCPAVAKSINEVPHKWSVLIAVFGNDGDNNYMKSELIQCDQPYYQRQLVDVMHENHQRIVDGFNMSHFVNFGWIASPDCLDVDEQKAGEFFESIGAWDNPIETKTA